MKEDEMLMCLIAFVLGYLLARMIRGNGFQEPNQESDQEPDYCDTLKKEIIPMVNINYSEESTNQVFAKCDDDLECVQEFGENILNNCANQWVKIN